MAPLSSIVTALAAGAAAGLKPAVEQAVKEGYASLKALIQRKYARINVDVLEQNPTSESRRAVIKEDLASVNAAADEELLRTAKALLDALQQHARDTEGATGVDLHDIKAAALTIEDVMATGTGVKATQVDVGGDITIKGVRAGDRGGGPPKG